MKEVKKISGEFTKNLIKKADAIFEGKIKKVSTKTELEDAVKKGLIAQCNFCSIEKLGRACADKLKDLTDGGEVRGTKLDEKEKPKGKCIICDKKANAIVYVGRSY